MTCVRLPTLLIPLAALLAVLPLLVHGCSCGHDLDFHLLSWQEAAAQFAHGTLHPRWAFTPAFGAGEPRFVFYPPLSWTLGALLTLAATALAALFHIAPATAVALTPAAYTWLALTLAGLAMLRLAQRFVSPTPATLAGVLYLANPYTLFTAYERTAFAELLAAALLPLLLAPLLPAKAEPRPLSLPAVACPLALLWLSNGPAAVIGSYALALLILLRVLPALLDPPRRRAAWTLCLRASAAAALGLALAAFYIVPVLAEQRWVQLPMAILTGLRPADNTLFHHTADPAHDAVLHTASRLAVLLLTLSFSACLVALRRRAHPAAARLLLALSLVIALLLTPLSLPIWRHMPELAYLQFPWRLLALLAPACVLALALAARSLHLRPPALAAAALLLPALLILPAYTTFHQPCDPEDTPQARLALFHSTAGDLPTDEYTPANADNDVLEPHDPAFFLLPQNAPDDLPIASRGPIGPTPHSLTLSLKDPTRIVFHLRDYPTWQVLVNGRIDPDRIARNDGLLTVPLPAGRLHLQIIPHTSSFEIAADLLSLAALAVLLTLLDHEAKREPHHPSRIIKA